MTFGFLSGSRNFCKLLWVYCEVLFLHGYAWIFWVARFCTTTAYRWLFRDSLSSLRTLWSAVIKSANCTALGTTVQVRLLQEPLVIFAFKQTSQVRSFGKCYSEPSSTFARDLMGNSWEELEVSWHPCSHSPQGALSDFHRPNSLWIPVANPAIHVFFRSVLLRVPYFLLFFCFCGFMQRVSP